jgi:hypothetical protein
VICFLPMVAAVYISITRVTDYWHHPEDVIVGALVGKSKPCAWCLSQLTFFLGTFCAIVGYRMYLPSPTEACCRGVRMSDYYDNIPTDKSFTEQ